MFQGIKNEIDVSLASSIICDKPADRAMKEPWSTAKKIQEDLKALGKQSKNVRARPG